MDDLKIRFTLLKHRKELRAEDRQVVSAVKDIWEALQNVSYSKLLLTKKAPDCW